MKNIICYWRLPLAIAVLGGFAVLLACGGGGGGGSDSATSTSTTATTTGTSATTSTSKDALTTLVSAVSSGNVATISRSFVTESWSSNYSEAFSSGDVDLNTMASELSGATLIKETDDTAIYRSKRIENGVESTYDIHMIKVDGEWKIFSM